MAEGGFPIIPHVLTEAQKRAYGELVDWHDHGANREALVWAVCGAGKTEVSFGAIAAALRSGRRVAYAAPRRDVVAELAPRIQSAFPGVPCAVFHGGSTQRDYGACITVLTTHQAMRFHSRFDLVILDEADAFPYYGSEALATALERTLVMGGRMVIMTATPSRGHLARVRVGSLPCVRISARHHGRPLPVPVVVETGGRSMGSAVAELARVSLAAAAPLFVFVPSRSRAPELSRELSPALPGRRVEWVHSGDPERSGKRESFASGRCDVLVTTSVMERGITVDGADVIVAEADWEAVFDYRSLVQMAGRAGRTSAHPAGRVWFVCSEANSAIFTAIGMIREMNDDAKARGLLCPTSDSRST